jgi:hypothetical protein
LRRKGNRATTRCRKSHLSRHYSIGLLDGRMILKD